jgi:hypothetical protein
MVEQGGDLSSVFHTPVTEFWQSLLSVRTHKVDCEFALVVSLYFFPQMKTNEPWARSKVSDVQY